MALALAALPACGKCRRLEPKEKPLERCVLYRHKEDLPLDAAPFFDLYADGQEPDSFRNLWLRDELPYRAPLFQTEGGIPGTSEGHKLTLEHQLPALPRRSSDVAAADLSAGRWGPTARQPPPPALQETTHTLLRPAFASEADRYGALVAPGAAPSGAPAREVIALGLRLGFLACALRAVA